MFTISGAGGQLGGLVTQALAARVPAERIRLVSRDPAKLPSGFASARGDFDDAASLDAAFAGAETLLIISGDAPVAERIRQHRTAVDAAKRAGVKRVVYTSFTNASPASRFTFAAIHADTEAYLKQSGLAWTALRNNPYAENLAGAVAGAKATGTLAMAGATGKVAYVTRADVAAAAAGALSGQGHEGKAYEITGPEALDGAEIAEVLSKAWGKPVTLQPLSDDAFAQKLAGFGLPPFLVEAVVSIQQASAAGEMAAISPDAETLAGRPLESVREWLAKV